MPEEATLNLEDLSPKQAPLLASWFVQLAQSVEGVRLDYSVASLKAVDNILEKMRVQRLSLEQVYRVLVLAGCYVGEVLVKAHGLRWTRREETPCARMPSSAPIVVEFGERKCTSPIDKVIKRLEYGKSESLVAYEKALTHLIKQR